MATLLIYMVGTFHFPYYLFQMIDFEKQKNDLNYNIYTLYI